MDASNADALVVDRKTLYWLIALAEHGIHYEPGCGVRPCTGCERRGRRAAKLAEVASKLGFKVEFRAQSKELPTEHLAIDPQGTGGLPDVDDEEQWP